MLSKRLLQIASLVPQGKVLLDVGTDHGLLPIYLVQNNICPKVLASDISENALESAKNNKMKYKAKNVELYVSDGLNDVPLEYDVISISGMGAYNILKILDKEFLPDTLILNANNNVDVLRKAMQKKGYKIVEEKIVFEKGKYYDIILYQKGKDHLTSFQKNFGKSNDLNYLTYNYEVQKKIYFKKKSLKRYINLLLLRKAIEKNAFL